MAQDETYRGDAPQSGSAGYWPPPLYGPPGYGYPPPSYPGTWRPPINGLAIAALVMALIPGIGIGLGIAARRQIRRTGEGGDGLALAGIIVGSVATGLLVLMIVLMVAVFSAATTYVG